MHIVEESYKGLYPEKEFTFDPILKYSGHFKGYNANVSWRLNQIRFKLSKQWKDVSRDIKIGLIQTLMCKVFKNKKSKTYHMELYHNFLKHVHISVPKTKIDPLLQKNFELVNKQYFGSFLEQPNLVWGTYSTQKLGSYDYGADMITISTALKQDEELLQYVLFHEMLHKKHKFSHSGARTHSHTKAFKEEEASFENAKGCEARLSYLPRNPEKARQRKPSLFRFLRF